MITADALTEQAGKEAAEVEAKRLNIPKFGMPNWPSGRMIEGYLYARRITIPVRNRAGKLAWKKAWRNVHFRIQRDSEIWFWLHEVHKGTGIHEECYHSRSTSDHERAGAVLLFERFKVEMLAQGLKSLREEVAVNDQIVDEVERAFKPFIPHIVADELSR